MNRRLAGEAIRFLAAGAANTLFTLVVYWLLLRVMTYPYAYTISFAAGILTGYALNTKLVFRQPWSWMKLLAFPSVHAVNYVLGMVVMWASISLLGVPQWAAPLVAVVAVLPANFLMTRFLIQARARPPRAGNAPKGQ